MLRGPVQCLWRVFLELTLGPPSGFQASRCHPIAFQKLLQHHPGRLYSPSAFPAGEADSPLPFPPPPPFAAPAEGGGAPPRAPSSSQSPPPPPCSCHSIPTDQ